MNEREDFDEVIYEEGSSNGEGLSLATKLIIAAITGAGAGAAGGYAIAKKKYDKMTVNRLNKKIKKLEEKKEELLESEEKADEDSEEETKDKKDKKDTKKK